MPSRSNKQARLMAMVKHNPQRARDLGFDVPQEVAAEYVAADQESGRLSRAMREKRDRKS